MVSRRRRRPTAALRRCARVRSTDRGAAPDAGGEPAGRLPDRHQPIRTTWHYSRAEGSPFNDIRIRKANLAIDRVGQSPAGGLSIRHGFVPPGSAWFGKVEEHRFDLAVVAA